MKGIIDHTNYEDYFLLYVDDELNAEERAAVDLFVARHPDLKSILESLLQTKLPADDAVEFPDKSKLFFDKPAVPDEAILLFLDKEPLDNEVREQLQNPSPELKQRIELFRKTIAVPDTSVAFPKREQLYKHTKVVSLKNWKMVAVAAMLILAVGYGIFQEQQKQPHIRDLAQGNLEIPVTSAGDTEGVIKADTIDDAPAKPASGVQEQQQAPEEGMTAKTVRKNSTVTKEKEQPRVLQNTVVSEKPAGPRKPAVVPEPEAAPVAAQQPVSTAKAVEPRPQIVPQPAAIAKAAVADENPAKEKKSFFKKLTKRIEEKVSATFDNGDGQVTVAGFAFNVK
ncbi:hypothetical protein A8C56_17330 [Niabella ginsenosidivorans]|uniref:Uncharacterized protein n=1 Tax=Niabella ginsenosidivorans TaxID=1176587 RepID=A0A1A9I498_9BACT|nr:hypothetical protein [Niabella ginsenosidivorans]ANH82498.1 hypothetical protein A8C56_17330 [Niabella ginsenosidivorans]